MTAGLFTQDASRLRQIVGPERVHDQTPSRVLEPAVLVARDRAGMTWSAPAEQFTPVVGYEAECRTDAGVLVDVQSLDADALGYNTPLLPDDTYTISVRAINGAGAGEVVTLPFGINRDEFEEPDPITLPPAGVRDVVAVNPATGQVRVDWLAPEAAPDRAVPTGYRVQILSGSVEVSRQEPVTALTAAFAVADGTYVARVTPLSTLGEGVSVTSGSVVVGGAVLTPPTAPQSVVASLSGSTLSLTYAAPATDAGRASVTGYRRELVRNGVVAQTSEVGSGVVSGSFPLTSDGSWSVRVLALSASGPGASATSNAVAYTAPVVEPDPVDDVLPVMASRPTSRPASKPEFVLSSSATPEANRADLQNFLNAAAENGADPQIKGSGRFSGFLNFPAALRFAHLDAELIMVGDQQGHVRRHGSLLTATTTSVTAGMTKFSEAITVASVGNFAVGDWVWITADDVVDHKPYAPGFLRQVKAINGNVLTLDLYLHRTCTQNRQVTKVQLASPFDLSIGPNMVLRHEGWKGSQTLISSRTGQPVQVADDGDNFVQQRFSVKFVLCKDTFVGSPSQPFFVDRAGSGVSGAANVGGEWWLRVDRITDLTRDAPTIAHWGYGLSEDGSRQTTYHLRSDFCRHAQTTQHNTWISQWDAGNVKGVEPHGETEFCRFYYDVNDTMSTGVNTHGGGWSNGHAGTITNTGRWGADAELKRDPTGLFFRSRRDYVLPSGLVLDNIATRVGKPWFAAITTAEKSRAVPDVFSLADGPTYSNLELRNHDTKAGISLKQPSTIGPNVVIRGNPGYPGIVVAPEAAGSRIIPPVTVIGGSTAVVGAQYLTGSELVTKQ